MATMWVRDGTSSSAALRTYYRWIAPVTVAVVAWLGYVATADLFDVSDRWWLTFELRWMGDRPFWHELVNGLAAAIVIPLAIGLTWGTFRRAGMIAGVGVGVLLHLTVGLVLVSGLYLALEWFVARAPAAVVRLAAIAVVLGAAAVVATALT
jgi:hypothetical protein